MNETPAPEQSPPTPASLLKAMVDGHYRFYESSTHGPEKEALPMLWAVDDKGQTNLIVTTFNDEVEKRMFCRILAPKILDLMKSPMYGFTSEAWVSVMLAKEGQTPEDVIADENRPPPSQDPERREVVFSLVVTRQNGVVESNVLEVLRDPFTKKISLVPFDQFGGGVPEALTGRMTELFTGGKVA